MTRVIVPISLPKDLDLKIEQKVKRGYYASKSEYVRKAVRETLVWEEEITKREKIAIQKGLKDIKAGRVSKAFSSHKELVKYLRGL